MADLALKSGTPGATRTPARGLGNRCSIHLSYRGLKLIFSFDGMLRLLLALILFLTPFSPDGNTSSSSAIASLCIPSIIC